MENVRSRWIRLVQTMPSGNQLWVCRCCGRVSAAREARCPEPATVHGGGPPQVVQCEYWERVASPCPAAVRPPRSGHAMAPLRIRF